MQYKPEFEGYDTKYILVIATLVVAGTLGVIHQQTSNSSIEAQQKYKQTSEGRPALALDTGSGDSVETSRKRIETIRMEFETRTVERASGRTLEKAKNYGGYLVARSHSQRHGESSRLEVRIPESNLSNFLGDVESQGWELKSRNQNIRDVTNQYRELELELENKKQEMKRLEELISSTNSTESLIKIQERLGELRSRIQYLEQRINELDKKIEFTTVEIRFEGPEPITSEFEVTESLFDAYKAIFISLKWIIVGTGYLIPFGAIYTLYRIYKRFKQDEK